MELDQIKDGENIFDVVIRVYGDVSKVIDLVKDNPSLTSLDNSDISQIQIVYDETYQPNLIKAEPTPNELIISDQLELRVQEGQSIFDVANMLKGDLNSIYDLIQKNNIDSVNKNLISNQGIKYIDQKLSLTNYVKNNNIIFNTSFPKIKTGKAFSGAFSSLSYF